MKCEILDLLQSNLSFDFFQYQNKRKWPEIDDSAVRVNTYLHKYYHKQYLRLYLRFQIRDEVLFYFIFGDEIELCHTLCESESC